MKKLVLIFLSIIFISCSDLNAYINGETKDTIMMKGVLELMSEQEKESFYSGKEANLILYRDPFRGIFAQVIKIATDSIPHRKRIEEAASYIYKYQNKIIVSDNTNIIQEAIEYIGTTEKGKEILPNCRFLFLNYVNREKIEKLSKEFGFKYRYPKVEDVK